MTRLNQTAKPSRSVSKTARKPSNQRQSVLTTATAGAKPAKKIPVTRHASRTAAARVDDRPKKPTTNARQFSAEVARKFTEAATLKAIYKGRVDAGFRETLMVSVAFQNNAPMCNWIHRIWATNEGVPADLLDSIERMQLDELEPRLATAVIYVRALAASEWQEVPRAVRLAMHEHFSWREIEDIELIAKAMDLSNRGGNTWQALLSRVRGQPVEGSDLLSEIILSSLILLAAPGRLRKVSRSTGVSTVGVIQSLLRHIEQFETHSSVRS